MACRCCPMRALEGEEEDSTEAVESADRDGGREPVPGSSVGEVGDGHDVEVDQVSGSQPFRHCSADQARLL